MPTSCLDVILAPFTAKLPLDFAAFRQYMSELGMVRVYDAYVYCSP